MVEEKKVAEGRLFVGAKIEAPWPTEFPAGRIIPTESRHVTLAFLGLAEPEKLKKEIKSLLLPSLSIGPVGWFNQVVFYPNKRYRRVVGWETAFYEKEEAFLAFREALCSSFREKGLFFDEKKFHPHVTIARGSFDPSQWEGKFKPLPFMIQGIYLYQSLGHSKYHVLWSYPMKTAFEELFHTADVAFLIRGTTIKEIHLHAQIALSFAFPEFFPYIDPKSLKENLDDLILSLNEIVTRADSEIGSPCKAISFHGEIREEEKGILNWEMIIDV